MEKRPEMFLSYLLLQKLNNEHKDIIPGSEIVKFTLSCSHL